MIPRGVFNMMLLDITRPNTTRGTAHLTLPVLPCAPSSLRATCCIKLYEDDWGRIDNITICTGSKFGTKLVARGYMAQNIPRTDVSESY